MASIPDYALAPPPPQPERSAEQPPRWPLWAPLAVVAIGLVVTMVVVGTLAAVLRSAGVNLDDAPGFTDASTLVLDLSIVAASIAVARRTARPAPWQFGLRRARCS